MENFPVGGCVIEYIKPSIMFETTKEEIALMMAKIERCGRTCYKSEDKITPDSSAKFIKALLKSGHESVLEHSSITARIICDRGVTHELVRHRVASYSQESTRYCRYNNTMQFVLPAKFDKWDNVSQSIFYKHCELTCGMYNELLKRGLLAQDARAILPNDLKTEIICTMNLREWRFFFIKRCAKDAHPDMQYVAKMLLTEMYNVLPIIFGDLYDYFICGTKDNFMGDRK